MASLIIATIATVLDILSIAIATKINERRVTHKSIPFNIKINVFIFEIYKVKKTLLLATF